MQTNNLRYKLGRKESQNETLYSSHSSSPCDCRLPMGSLQRAKGTPTDRRAALLTGTGLSGEVIL
jgi:hypothetical protein